MSVRRYAERFNDAFEMFVMMMNPRRGSLIVVKTNQEVDKDVLQQVAQGFDSVVVTLREGESLETLSIEQVEVILDRMKARQ